MRTTLYAMTVAAAIFAASGVQAAEPGGGTAAPGAPIQSFGANPG